MLQKSISLEYQPAWEPQHISVTPEPSTALQALGGNTLRGGPSRDRGVLSHLFFPHTSLACDFSINSPTSGCSGGRRSVGAYRGTSLIRNSEPLGPYSRLCPGLYGAPKRGGCFLCARYPCRVGATDVLTETSRLDSAALHILGANTLKPGDARVC